MGHFVFLFLRQSLQEGVFLCQVQKKLQRCSNPVGGSMQRQECLHPLSSLELITSPIFPWQGPSLGEYLLENANIWKVGLSPSAPQEKPG